MKLIAFLFIIFVSNSCSTHLIRFIPKDFEYPDNKIGAGKTFVYYNIDSNQTEFRNIRLINDKDYRSITTYRKSLAYTETFARSIFSD